VSPRKLEGGDDRQRHPARFEGGERNPVTGRRRTRYVTVKGTKKAAQIELIRLLSEVENGTIVEPSKVTLAEYLRGWLVRIPVIVIGHSSRR
jgi:hypothetical protein